MSTKRFPAARVLSICFALLACTAKADHFVANWLENNLGIWQQDGVWSTSAYPNNGHTIPGANGQPVPGPNPTYDVLIANSSPCTLGIFARVETVNVFQGATLNVGNNGYLWANTGFGNAGLITLNSNGNFTGLLRATANSNVVAGGEIFMTDHASNSVTAGAGGKILTISAGGRIRGAGNINAYHGDDIRTYFQIVNHGLIEALHPNNPLRVQLTPDPVFTNAMINDGTLRASGPAVLRISAPFGTPGNILNDGGTIEAVDNGTVRLQNTATITGGILATSGNGTIRGDASPGGGTFKDLTNIGTMVIGQEETMGVAGTFTNNGLVRIDATTTAGSGLLLRGSPVVLTGSGLIAMDGGAGIAGGDGPGQTAIIGSALTIRGKGIIGTNNSNFLYKGLNLVNQGLIDATGPLTMFTNTSQSTEITNNGGTLRASNGGQLNFNGDFTPGRVLNSGGTVEALDGSIVRVNNLVTIEGGTVTSSGTGTIRGGAPNTNLSGTLKNVTNNGSVAVPPGELLGVAGAFINNGSVRIEASSNQDAALVVREDVTLAGSGSFTMIGGFRAIFAGADAAGRTVTVTPGFTIRGDGRIGDNSSIFQHKTLRLVNQGTIDAPGYMWIGVNSSQNANFSNNGGLLRLGSGGYMEVNGPGTVTNSNGGTIEVRSGGNVQFVGGATLANYDSATQTLTGGTYFANSGTLNLNIGQVKTNAATVILSGASAQFTPINSMTQNDGIFVLTNGATRTFSGTTGISARSDAPSATFPNAGTLVIGQNSSININGDFAQGANGKLEVVIGSASQPTALNVTGAASLAGTLEVKLAPGYTPPAGTNFPILNAASRSGGFTQVIGANVSYGPNGVTVQPTGNTNALQLVSAVSRKIHGAAGALDIPLPLSGEPAVECRSSGGNHTLVFTFSNDIASGNVSATGGTGSVIASRTFAGRTLSVDLTGVSDAQQITVALSDVTDVFSQVLPSATVAMKTLVGDTNGNRQVNATDIAQTKAQAGMFVTQANCRQDVTVNGSINASDVGLVKSRSGATVP
jgi:hypothetical protein